MPKIFLLNYALWVGGAGRRAGREGRGAGWGGGGGGAEGPTGGPAGGGGTGVGGAGRGGHPIYTILSVSILKKMLDGFYMKIMDLTIQ